MTKTLLLILTLILSLNIFAQKFEGEIILKNTYKSNIPNVSDEQLTSMMGSTQDYFIKGGDYRSNTNGTMVLWQLYINKDNKLYNKLAGSETILWNDGSTNTDEVLKSELRKNVTEILGYQCDELVLTCKSGIQKYYFSSKLGVESSMFAKHKFGNWAEYISRAGALPLKTIVENSQFTVESVATDIKPMVLDNALFVLPAGAKTAKSPY